MEAIFHSSLSPKRKSDEMENGDGTNGDAAAAAEKTPEDDAEEVRNIYLSLGFDVIFYRTG